MPVENERKYVLPRDFGCDSLSHWTRQVIRQGYLDDGPRLRQKNDDYIFTYKKWVPQASELVEIETPMSVDDFNLLWPLCVGSLQKLRFEYRDGDFEWVVDFLQDASGDVYFVMAEVEMPRHQKAPSTIPDEIAQHIVHAVVPEDNRFTNKTLCDLDYAGALYAEVLAGNPS